MLDADGVRPSLEGYRMAPDDIDCMVQQSTTATSVKLGNMNAFTEEQAYEWAARCNIDVSRLYYYAD